MKVCPSSTKSQLIKQSLHFCCKEWIPIDPDESKHRNIGLKCSHMLHVGTKANDRVHIQQWLLYTLVMSWSSHSPWCSYMTKLLNHTFIQASTHHTFNRHERWLRTFLLLISKYLLKWCYEEGKTSSACRVRNRIVLVYLIMANFFKMFSVQNCYN